MPLNDFSKITSAFLLAGFIGLQPVQADEHIEELAAFVDQGMKLWQVPGMAVSVVNSDEVLFQQGFGTTSIEDGIKVDEHTLFANASTTKAMVAAGLLILEQDGKLSLDDRVTKFIPELHFNTALLTQQVSVRDLLAHRTGLPGTKHFTRATYFQVFLCNHKPIAGFPHHRQALPGIFGKIAMIHEDTNTVLRATPYPAT